MADLSPLEKENRRSPTETLVHVMEEFGRSEPLDCVVAWIDENGDFCWSQSTRSRTILIGLVEMIKHLELHKLIKERE